MTTKEEVAEHLRLLKLATEDDKDELLLHFLLATYPTNPTQDN